MPGWRVVIVSSEAEASLRLGSLCLASNDSSLSVPLEDIHAIVFENPRGRVSLALLSAASEAGVSTIFVNDKHMPCGVLIPVGQSPRENNLIRQQVELREPFKKRLWQAIIRQKILNSASCLDLLGREGGKQLRDIARTVASGDSTGREAHAARLFFRKVEAGFQRHGDSAASAALDYGYAVLRATLARSLAAVGFACALGISHNSRSNNFNLADDLLEPYRPFVDLHVFSNPPRDELTRDYREYLVSVLHLECDMSTGTYTLATASDETALSLARAMTAHAVKQLQLPSLREHARRVYE